MSTFDLQPLTDAVAALLALRRDVQFGHDQRVVEAWTTPPAAGGPHEERQQTLGALLRQLDEAARLLREARTTFDQLQRVEARVAQWEAAGGSP